MTHPSTDGMVYVETTEVFVKGKLLSTSQCGLTVSANSDVNSQILNTFTLKENYKR